MTVVKPGNKAIVARNAFRVPMLAGALVLGGLVPDGQAQTAQPSARVAQQTPAPAAAKPRPAPVAAPTPPAAATQGASTSSGKSDDVVARVGNSSLSGEEIRGYIAKLAPREQAAITQDPSLLSQAVRNLLASRLVLQELQGKKWDQRPEVGAQLERMREGALVELYLDQVSTPPANFPSDDELQKVYDANRSAFLVPRQFQLAQIFVAVPKDADKAAEDNAKKAIDDIQRKLKGGADFTSLANETGSQNGGDLGLIPEPQIRPEIRNQVIGLAKNGVSDIIKLDDGWHILKMVDTKASYTRTLPEVKAQLVQQIRAERANALRRTYVAELLKKTPPAINELALSKVLDDANRAKR